MQTEKDLDSVARDIQPPAMVPDDPAPGRRVRRTLGSRLGRSVYHSLYLPTDWRPGGRWPVIVEYAGNGGYRNAWGDVCTGKVEDCNLGYGLTEGKGFIWAALPFVDQSSGCNAISWWGDTDATTQYCIEAVQSICGDWGGDPSRIVISGFSRGAIACNYIGLHNDRIASLWRAFFAHSHYDGVRAWKYHGSDRAAALDRLHRLAGRPQWISHEISVEETRAYIESTGVPGKFTFTAIPYRNHRDDWVLRPVPQRDQAREWLKNAVK